MTYDETIKILLHDLNKEFGYTTNELKPKLIHTSTPVHARNTSMNDISTCVSSMHEDITDKPYYENLSIKQKILEKN